MPSGQYQSPKKPGEPRNRQKIYMSFISGIPSQFAVTLINIYRPWYRPFVAITNP